MNSKIISILIFSLTSLLLVNVVNAASNYVIIHPTSCTDSDGNCQLSNVQSQDGVTESQVGHANAVRFIETVNSNSSAITSPDSIDNVTVYIDRFESANPGGQTVTLQVRRPSDNTASSCTLSAKTANDSVYNGCDVTTLVTGSSTPESDAEGLTISYRIQALGNANTFYLDHTYVNITYTDSSGPTVILGNPVNNTWNNTNAITFSFTPNDTTSGISSCTLVVDNALNQTNTSITEGQENYIITTLNEGIHTWTVNCTDTSANANIGTNTTQKTINVDLTRSNVQLSLPSNNSVVLSSNVTFNFTTTDNLSPTTNCSVYLDNILNQTNSSVSNNTLTNFVINGISQGSHQWNITCNDLANNSNSSITRTFTVNVTPILTSVSDSPDPVKGGNVIIITASGIDDPNNDTLYLYCSESSTTPNSTNTNCTGGTTTDTLPPYSLTCTYATATDDTTHTTYCRVFDGTYYSSVVNTTYTTDFKPPTTSIVSVAGDTSATYYDNVNDGKTDMIISGEASMVCRYGTSDVVYSSMTNDCTITGTQANCSATTTTQGLDAYNFYVSCQDSLGNEQNTTQNLDITALVHDWTAATTSDNSSTTVTVPNYVVKITESDNLFSTATITTKYCTDTTGSCIPDTAIDDDDTVTFTSSNRGINFLRYNSSDPASNVQTIQNKTININQLPTFTSASDNATTIKGGSGVKITTVSSDADSGQTLKLYVCNSTSVNSSGCTHTTYCSNTTTTVNASCSFASETDDTTHTWYAFLYDQLNESATTNTSGIYTTDSTAPTITVINPQNQTYSETSVSAQLSLSETGNWIGYSLDNAANVTMTNSTPTFWSAIISSLSNGAHVVRSYANDSYGNMGTNNKAFSIDTSLTDSTPPSMTVWSPVNGTYYISASVLTNITLSEAGSNATYSLDNAANISLGNVSSTNWNKTITVSEGLHNITFYANDTSTNRNTGNSSIIYFYVDASAPQNTTQGPTTANDTVNITCYSQWTDNVALDYGILQHNETGTATNSSQISLSGTSGWVNYIIDSTNTTPSIIQCKAYAFDKAGLVNTSSWLINITDVTAPLVENISYIPNTTDNLDPNVMINVTVNVSDNLALSKVLLQYRSTTESIWNETQMTIQSGNIYRGNFTPVTGNYSFRIFANDTSNNTNSSSITNVSVALDYTWINVATVPATKSIVQTEPREINLGNLTINNTADYDLNFTVTSNRNWISFNGTNTSLIFIVNSTYNSTRFNVTANTTGFAVGSYTYNITIGSYTLNPTLVSSQILNGTVVIQNVAGPYFIVTITAYDATVTQGDAGIVLTANLENAGTGDATNTWLNWTLPSGWTNTSGILNKLIGFLGVGSTVTNNITVSISSSASTGAQTITADASSSEGTTGSDSKSVTVSSPTAASQPSVSTGAGGADAPSVSAGLESLLLQTNETLELIRGKNDTFIIKVANPYKDSNLTNISLDVKGFLAQYIGLSPEFISSIEYNKTGFFKVTITAPAYLTKGSHILNFTIKGRMISGAFVRNIVEKRIVTLAVHEVSREEANTTLQQIENAINEMKDSGFSITSLQKLLDQSKKAFDEKDYEKVKELSEDILSIKNTAFSTYNLIQEVREKIKQAEDNGLRVDATKNLLNMALAAFEREDYSIAERRAKDAQLVYAIETVGKINIVKFLMDNWRKVLVFLAIASAAGVIVYRRLIVVIITRRLRDLAIEEANIFKLMKDAQRKTYVEKKMSSREYHKAIYEHEKRLDEIKGLRTRLRAKRVGIIKVSRELDNLKEEDDDIISQMKNIQRDHFEKRSINKATYERRMEALRLRRAEIEDALAVLETKLTKEKRLRELKKLTFVEQLAEKIKTLFKRRQKEIKKKPEEVGEIKEAYFGKLFTRIKKFFKERLPRKRIVEIKPEKTEIQKIEERIAEKVEEVPVEKIPKPIPLSKSFGKLKVKVQDKLSELSEKIERKLIDVKHEQTLKNLYRGKSQYDFSRKFGHRNIRKHIGLSIKRLIGKIKFKLS